MKEKKQQVKLKEKERLLTEQERCYIITNLENRDWRIFFILCLVLVFLLIFLSMLFFYLGGIKDAIVCFSAGVLFTVTCYLYMLIKSNKLLKRARKNEVYVKEAVYLGGGKYGYGYFEIIKNGKKIIKSATAVLQDKVREGEKVIIVNMGRKYVWVYKAREALAENNQEETK